MTSGTQHHEGEQDDSRTSEAAPMNDQRLSLRTVRLGRVAQSISSHALVVRSGFTALDFRRSKIAQFAAPMQRPSSPRSVINRECWAPLLVIQCTMWAPNSPTCLNLEAEGLVLCHLSSDPRLGMRSRLIRFGATRSWSELPDTAWAKLWVKPCQGLNYLCVCLCACVSVCACVCVCLGVCDL